MTAPGYPRAAGITALVGYVVSIVAANWLTARYGLVPVLPGLLTTAGTFAAGFALLLRDAVQDALGRLAMLAAVMAGAVISWAMSTPTLAVASGAAFLVAELADMAAYTPLRDRGWARAVLVSNVAGAVVDTFLFLALADFPLTVQTVGGQLVGKLLWATLLPVLAVKSVTSARRPA